MDEDLIVSLTRQVREDVIENYLTERRLVHIQIEELDRLADENRCQAALAGKRLTRLAHLMTHRDMLGRLVDLLRIPPDSYWSSCLEESFAQNVRFIRVRALTDKGKFRKLMLEAYRRLFLWMERYRKSYEDLAAECRAVNRNIEGFQRNFDLLAIMNFLRNLDTRAVERRHFLGENFTAQERASLDQQLAIRTIAFEQLNAPPPLELPRPDLLEEKLSSLASLIFSKYQSQVKKILE